MGGNAAQVSCATLDIILLLQAAEGVTPLNYDCNILEVTIFMFCIILQNQPANNTETANFPASNYYQQALEIFAQYEQIEQVEIVTQALAELGVSKS